MRVTKVLDLSLQDHPRVEPRVHLTTIRNSRPGRTPT